jgi:hypothetical protein
VTQAAVIPAMCIEGPRQKVWDPIWEITKTKGEGGGLSG